MTESDTETYYTRLPEQLSSRVDRYRDIHNLSDSEAVRDLIKHGTEGPFERACRFAESGGMFFAIALSIWGGVLVGLWPLGILPAQAAVGIGTLVASGALASALTAALALTLSATGLAAKIDAEAFL